MKAKSGQFVFNAGLDGQPVECAAKWCDMIIFACFENQACCGILNFL